MNKTIAILLGIALMSIALPSAEGMWLLGQIPTLDLPQKGLEIDPSQIYSPVRPSIAHAIVHLGGGTAELVSGNGLILTNHHVAFGAVQRVSAKIQETDLITSGYLARRPEDEIEAPGYSAYILEEMRDVTRELSRYQEISDPERRQRAIDSHITKITEKIEKGKPDISAKVAEMYNGKQYILFVHKRFDDVRVVYVPPASIGNFGGDIDNWMWPRHTGDFSFMRIYMAPDGSGRKFHKDNVPYRPNTWLRIAEKGLKEGDFTFIIGYPGSTTRYRTSHSVKHNFSYSYPRSIALFKKTIALLDAFSNDSTTARMKLAGFSKGLNNVLKNYQGRMEAAERSGLLEKTEIMERELTGFLGGDASLASKYGKTLPAIEKLYSTLSHTREHDVTIDLFYRFSGQMASIATRLYQVAKEREKPKKERDPFFSEKDIDREASRLHFRYLSYYEPADKALLKRTLAQAGALPEDQKIRGLDSIFKTKMPIEAFIEELYEGTRLKDVEYTRTLYKKSSKELEALNDPFILLAQWLYPEMELKRKRDKAFGAKITALRKMYIDALLAWKGKEIYPDANSTIRFTYGRVEGYTPRDAVRYTPFTTLGGVLEKETGQEPFIVPDRLKKLHGKMDFGRWAHPAFQDVPVAFIHKCDITGGNSGSPVLNARGELVGIAFDGNYEAMNSDWQYDPELQRTISVDIRYVLFVTEKFANAGFILEEMGIH